MGDFKIQLTDGSGAPVKAPRDFDAIAVNEDGQVYVPKATTTNSDAQGNVTTMAWEAERQLGGGGSGGLPAGLNFVGGVLYPDNPDDLGSEDFPWASLRVTEHVTVGLPSQATDLLTIANRADIGDLINVDGSAASGTFVQYAIVATAAAPLEISRGADVAGTVANIVAALNGSDGINTPNDSLTATSPGAGQVLATAIPVASLGNKVYAEYVNFGAGTNAFANQYPAEPNGYFTGGNQPAVTGAIRLREGEFLKSDDAQSGWGIDGAVSLIGYDAEGEYICIGGEEPGEAPATIIAGGLEVRRPDSEEWKAVSASDFVRMVATSPPEGTEIAAAASILPFYWYPTSDAVHVGSVSTRLEFDDVDTSKFHWTMSLVSIGFPSDAWLSFNQDGVPSLPLLPTSNPGPGLLWCDTGAGNVVKVGT